MTMILDISPLVSEKIGVFPGDVPYRRTASLAIASGANIDLSAVHTTVHVGAHADAPSHYQAGGQHIAARPLELYYGPCQVVDVPARRGARVEAGDFAAVLEAPRVLFKTGTFPDPEAWNDDFASLAPGLVEQLHASGVRLVGIDTPSIDPCHDPVLESHQVVARFDMAILEGLVLAHVPAGLYTLIALPLRLGGADASPVRAVLLRTSSGFPG